MNETTTYTYPLMDSAEGWLRTATGRSLADVTLDTVAEGQLTADDIRIRAETLLAQAAIARESGYDQLAANLSRAAELTAVPNEEILKMYEQLRPGRSSYEELVALASRLEERYHAAENGRLVREAAAVYQARGLLK